MAFAGSARGMGDRLTLFRSLALSLLGRIAFGVAIAIGAAFSVVSTTTIPFALSMVPPQKAGLGTGIFSVGRQRPPACMAW
ncbi:MAG: hypothetical protein IGR76_17360 [Synechococcales cyanobacterium T60_A2020_003]|nr:hypothetical protein [Synechococcales cyanobacterium T60_A2020_003]